MGFALPFSQIDVFLKELGGEIPGCIVDTNFLIATTYENHPFSNDAEFLFEKMAEHQVPIYSTVTTRSEFLDVWRRIIITEALMGMLAKNSNWRLTKKVKAVLKKHKAWIDMQAAQDEMPLLTDRRIKDCKEVFFPKAQSGKSGWVEICGFYLSGKMDEYWALLLEGLGINHIDLSKPEIQKLITSKVRWTEMARISEETCLGTSDSMILNMLKSSVFPFVVSGDYDMAYAILLDETKKAILIPDSLYRNKIKNLKL